MHVFSHSFSLSFYRGPRGVSHHRDALFFCIRGGCDCRGVSRRVGGGDGARDQNRDRPPSRPPTRAGPKGNVSLSPRGRKENKKAAGSGRARTSWEILNKITSSSVASRSHALHRRPPPPPFTLSIDDDRSLRGIADSYGIHTRVK